MAGLKPAREFSRDLKRYHSSRPGADRRQRASARPQVSPTPSVHLAMRCGATPILRCGQAPFPLRHAVLFWPLDIKRRRGLHRYFFFSFSALAFALASFAAAAALALSSFALAIAAALSALAFALASFAAAIAFAFASCCVAGGACTVFSGIAVTRDADTKAAKTYFNMSFLQAPFRRSALH